MTEQEQLELLKKEQFAHQYAFGVPLQQALAAAGYKPASVSIGIQLLQDPHVLGIIQNDRDWIKAKLVESTQSIAQQLDRDREYAYAMGNPGAAVTASMNKAKVLGLLEPDQSSKVPARIVIEWQNEEQASDG